MPDLDERLRRTRATLMETIDQPPLEQIAGQATALRRRRRAASAGAALVAVVAVAVLLVRPWSADPIAEVPPADSRPPAGPVYADLGITINGLTGEAVDLPGAIADVEFADPDHGYLITTEQVFASTADGGLTWQRHPLPSGTHPTDLILFPNGTLALRDGFYSDDGGATWRTAPAKGPAGEDKLLLGQMNTILIRSPEYVDHGTLTSAGPVTPTWVAERPAADGTWWVGGFTADGRPAVASTRNRGQSWEAQNLDAPKGSSVQVSVLGSHAYAIVLGADRQILAILHSADGGKTFARTWNGSGAEAALAGEAVPLLDGRLLITTATQRWYVSSDDGATFAQADGSLPMAGPIRRTAAGYVVYHLFGPEPAGWVAFSSDGSTWRKLHVR